jgi:hypothetical protein
VGLYFLHAGVDDDFLLGLDLVLPDWVDLGSIFVTISLQRGVVIFFSDVAIATGDVALVQVDGGDLAIAMGDVILIGGVILIDGDGGELSDDGDDWVNWPSKIVFPCGLDELGEFGEEDEDLSVNDDELWYSEKDKLTIFVLSELLSDDWEDVFVLFERRLPCNIRSIFIFMNRTVGYKRMDNIGRRCI